MKAEGEIAVQLEGAETWSTSRDRTSTMIGSNKGISILDLILRFLAAAGTFAGAIAMGTTDQTLTSIFPQFTQVGIEYRDLPSFTFFVVANSIVCGYLFLSLPLSIFHIVRRGAKISRLILVIFDTVMLGLVTAGASAAASIVYLAHEGNSKANWLGFCQQFDSFCQRISGALIGSFAAAFVFILIIIESSVAISRP